MKQSSSNKTSEQQRLLALRKLQILDTPFETIFDSVAKLAAEICGTPIALISLVDEKRQWFKSNIGMEDVCETPRDISFCARTIQTDSILEIADASQDERFWDNPLVTGIPEIKFYCGAPLTMPLGENIGTLCVLDKKVNYLSETQRIALKGLAKIVTELLLAREINIRSRISTMSEN